MKKKNGQYGITIISLVVTIIVLMILAGISIYSFTRYNGTVDEAKEKAKIEDYKTQMEKILLDLQAESSLGLSNENLMEKFAEEVKKIEGISEEDIEIEEEKVKVKTQEGFEFEITIYGVEYIGKNGELLDSDDIGSKENTPQQGEVKIIYDKVSWNSSKEITLEANDQEIEYAIGEESWTQYVKDKKIKIDKNNIMLYARIKGNTDKDKETREIITNIDAKSPIELNLEEIKNDGKEYEIKVTATDDEKTNESGISGISKFEFLYSTDGEMFLAPKDGGIKEVIPKETAEITYSFLELTEKMEYTIKVIAYDQAGNKIEETKIVDNTSLLPTVMSSDDVINYLSLSIGTYVNYKIDLDANPETPDWRIFYAQNVDEKPRIYLISADYVPTEMLEQLSIKQKTGLTNAKYDSSYEALNVNWPSGRSNLEVISTPSNWQKLFKDGNEGKRYTWNSNYQNSRCVSTMLQPSYWESFISQEIKVKEEKVEEQEKTFAIGGPTIQMWCAAWNAIIPIEGKDGFCQITSDTYGSYGYYYSSSSASNMYQIYINGVDSLLSDTSILSSNSTYKLFFPHTAASLSESDSANGVTSGTCYGYWLASPSEKSSDYIMFARCNGRLGYSKYDDSKSHAIRPVICLSSDNLLIDSGKKESGKQVYDLK